VQGVYDGRCRDLGITDADSAWRLRMPYGSVAFDDRIQGHVVLDPHSLGDPVLVRRDGIAAYQLAVVVDDAFQRITDVVRGADLLDSTGWQVVLGRALGLPVPRYAHVPVLTDPDGGKLSKSRSSRAVADREPAALLAETLALLGLMVPPQLKAAAGSDMLRWAVQHWRPQVVAGIRSLPLLSGSQLA
jgi:glutamyl-Q tRNA(Asp) synthetase